MDDLLDSFRDPNSLIWSVEIPILEIDLSGIEPGDYLEYTTLLLEALKDRC